MPTGTPLYKLVGYEDKMLGNSNVFGRDSLMKEYTRTGVLGQMAVNALDRLIEDYRNNTNHPFALSVQFNGTQQRKFALHRLLR